MDNRAPALTSRIGSVWFRHYKVYTRDLISNGFPPFLEPLIFLAAIGLGMGRYVGLIDDVPYLLYLASAILVTPAMYTASFECTFGTFIRLEYDKSYDGMLASPLTVRDIFLGEILFAGTKGMFFSAAVLAVLAPFGLIPNLWTLLTPIGGFLTGLLFGAISLFVTSFVKNINHFNFYFTGLLTPMFFFSGIIFPLENLPSWIRPVAEVFPLTHCARLVRGVYFADLKPYHLFALAYLVIATLVFGELAVRRLEKRLLS